MPEKLFLNIRQLGILNELAARVDDGWLRPLDLGGRNGSYHSDTLNQLRRKGLVVGIQRTGMKGLRGSKVYQISAKGIEVIESMEVKSGGGRD